MSGRATSKVPAPPWVLRDTAVVSCRAPGKAICHMPRPCVAMRSVRLVGWIAMSKTATRGRPVPKGVQLAPPSVEVKTPISVPA